MIRRVIQSLKKGEVWLIASIAFIAGLGLHRGGLPLWASISTSLVLAAAWYGLGSWRVNMRRGYRFRRYWRPCPTCDRDPWSKDFWEDHNAMGHVSTEDWNREP